MTCLFDTQLNKILTTALQSSLSDQSSKSREDENTYCTVLCALALVLRWFSFMFH